MHICTHVWTGVQPPHINQWQGLTHFNTPIRSHLAFQPARLCRCSLQNRRNKDPHLFLFSIGSRLPAVSCLFTLVNGRRPPQSCGTCDCPASWGSLHSRKTEVTLNNSSQDLKKKKKRQFQAGVKTGFKFWFSKVFGDYKVDFCLMDTMSFCFVFFLIFVKYLCLFQTWYVHQRFSLHCILIEFDGFPPAPQLPCCQYYNTHSPKDLVFIFTWS